MKVRSHSVSGINATGEVTDNSVLKSGDNPFIFNKADFLGEE